MSKSAKTSKPAAVKSTKAVARKSRHSDQVIAGMDFKPAPAVEVAAVPPVVKRTIEKNREERNGVKRPSVGGACRAVWDFCDDKTSADYTPSIKEVKAEAEARGWNANNASIEYYNWRKFMGLRGRQKQINADDASNVAQ